MQTAYPPDRAATAAGALARGKLDNALLRSIAAGDKGAMQLLVQRHSVRIYRFALRLVEDTTLAEGIMREVFIDIWRGARRLEASSEVTTWLLAIARQKAKTALRHRPRARLDGQAAARVDPSEHPEVVTHQPDRSQIVRQCLAQLSSPHREIVDLVYYHTKSIDDVAQIVGLSRNAIKSLMIDARREIAKLASTARADVS